jgi:hypothetical protein
LEWALTVESTPLRTVAVEQLARQLREAYPDESFERTLRCERDTAAEERHSNAINELARIVANAAARGLFRDADESE